MADSRRMVAKTDGAEAIKEKEARAPREGNNYQG